MPERAPTRRIKKRYIALALALVPLLWFGFRIFDAATAKPGQPVDSFAQLVELSESIQPSDGENGWPVFLEAIEALQSVTSAGIQGWPDDEIHASELDNFYRWTAAGTTPQDDALMRALLNRYEQAGVFELTARLAQTKRALRPNEIHTTFLFATLLPEAASGRTLAKVLVAQMHRASLDNDHEQMVSTFEQLLALSRTIGAQPFLIDGLVGYAIRALAQRELAHLLQDRQFTQAQCEDLLDAMKQSPLSIDISYLIECERINAFDAIHRLHSDDGNGDGILLTSQLTDFTFGAPPPAAGAGDIRNVMGMFYPGKRATSQTAQEFYDLAKRAARTPAAERHALNVQLTSFHENLPRRQIVLKMLISSLDRTIAVHDASQSIDDATRILLAIEIFEAQHGRVPDTLDELAPDTLESIPLDALNGLPFVYRLIPESQRTAKDPRPFVLCSVGPDGIDETDPANVAQPARATPVGKKSDDRVYNELREEPYDTADRSVTGDDSRFDAPVSEWNKDPDPPAGDEPEAIDPGTDGR